MLAERARLSAVRRATPEGERTPWANDEVFTASALTNGGFACADFDELGRFYTHDTLWGAPMRHPRLLPPHDGLLYHPVRDGDAYLQAIERGDSFEPPLDPATILELYAHLDPEELSGLKRRVLALALRGTGDDPATLFGADAPARRLLDASPTADTMQAVVRTLGAGRRALGLAALRRDRAFRG